MSEFIVPAPSGDATTPPAEPRHGRLALLAITLALLLVGLQALASRERGPANHAYDGPAERAAWERGLDTWQQARLASVAGPDGWATLTALAWLAPGVNPVGTDSARDTVRLPAGRVPASVGTITVAPGAIAFRAARGATVTVNGAPVDSVALATDAGGQKPTVLAIGAITLRVLERGGRLAVRVKDTLAPARLAFRGLEYFPRDPAWRLNATFERHDPVRTLKIINILGQPEDYPNPGALVFTVAGTTYRLEAAQEKGDSALFVIFRDETSRDASYEAGRFLKVNPPDAAGRADLDFNRAYNPPCAFSAFATCPLPPPQNRLAVRIPAGGKRYAGGHPR